MTYNHEQEILGGYEPPTEFAELMELTGLNTIEAAAEYLGIDEQNVRRMKWGKKPVPQGIMDELRDLLDDIQLVVEGKNIELPKGAQRKAEKEIFRLHQLIHSGRT